MHTQSQESQLSFLCQFLTFPHPPSDKALTLTTGLSLDRQNWGPFPYTSRGPLLLWESVWAWKRSGGVHAWYGGRYVEGTKPDMMVEKQSRMQEEIEQSDKQLCSCFSWAFWFKIWFCIFLFVHPSTFCSFLLPLGGSHLSSLIVKTPAFQWLSCTLAEL